MSRQDDRPPDSVATPGGDVTVDEMNEESFPASDPPATWTWEVRPAEKPAADLPADPG
jgi:hypothetical protein